LAATSPLVEVGKALLQTTVDVLVDLDVLVQRSAIDLLQPGAGVVGCSDSARAGGLRLLRRGSVRGIVVHDVTSFCSRRYPNRT
jgi:hypothetical protein